MALLPGPAAFFDLASLHLSPEPAEFEQLETGPVGELASLDFEMQAFLDGVPAAGDTFQRRLSDADLSLSQAETELTAQTSQGAIGVPYYVYDNAASGDQLFLDALSAMPPETWQELPGESTPPDTGAGTTQYPNDSGSQPI